MDASTLAAPPPPAAAAAAPLAVVVENKEGGGGDMGGRSEGELAAAAAAAGSGDAVAVADKKEKEPAVDNEAAYLLLGLVEPHQQDQQPSPPASSTTTTMASSAVVPAVSALSPPQPVPAATEPARPPSRSPVPLHLNPLPPPPPPPPAAAAATAQAVPPPSSSSQYLSAPAPPTLQTKLSPSPTLSSASLNNLLNGPSPSPSAAAASSPSATAARSPPAIVSNVVPINPPAPLQPPPTHAPLVNGFGQSHGSGVPLVNGGGGHMDVSKATSGPGAAMAVSHLSNGSITPSEAKQAYHPAAAAWSPPNTSLGPAPPQALQPTPSSTSSSGPAPLLESTLPNVGPSTSPQQQTSILPSPLATGQRKRKRSEAPSQAPRLSPKPSPQQLHLPQHPPQLGVFPATAPPAPVLAIQPHLAATSPTLELKPTPASTSAAVPAPPASASTATDEPSTVAEGEDGEQGYRCGCGTDIEEGDSIQCDKCKYWQHMGCYIGADQLTDDDKFYCERCAPHSARPKRHTQYISWIRDLQKRRDNGEPPAPLEGPGGIPESSAGGLANGAANAAAGGQREAGKKGRGGGAKKARVREPSGSAVKPGEAEGMSAQDQLQATGGDVNMDAAGALEERGGVAAQAAKEKKKRPTAQRPPKVKAVAREATPKEPGSDHSPTTSSMMDQARKSPAPAKPVQQSAASAAAAAVAAAAAAATPGPAELPAEPEFSPTARLLDFVPVKQNILRGPEVRSAMAGLIEEWGAHAEDLAAGPPKKKRRAPSMGRSGAEDGGAGPTRASGLGLDASFDVLGPPVPPVIAFGAGFLDTISPSYVREKDSNVSTHFPASTLAYEPRPDDEQTTDTSVRFCRLYGVHSTNQANVGAFFGEYIGEVHTADAYQRDPVNQYALLGMPKPFAHRLGPPLDLVLDARCYGNDLRFIRSGCHPNVVIRPFLHQPSSKNTSLRIAFGIFASSTIVAGQELVLGWEWDDQHVIHLLAETTAASASARSSKTDKLTPPARMRLALLAKQLLGSLGSCACPDDRKCALWRLLQVSMPEAPVTKGLPGSTGKGGLGPLIGAVRGWRFKAVQEHRARVRLEALAQDAPAEIADEELELEAEEEHMADDEEEVGDVDMDAAPADDEVDLASDHGMDVDSPVAAVHEELPEDGDETEEEGQAAKPDQPPVETSASDHAPTSPLTMPPTSPVVAMNSFNEHLSDHTSPSEAVHAVPMLSDKDDDGHLSETSTLTEPLTHATDSEDSDVDESVGVEPQVVGASSRKSADSRRREQLMNQSNRTPMNAFRKGRRILSPSPGAGDDDDDERFGEAYRHSPEKKASPAKSLKRKGKAAQTFVPEGAPRRKVSDSRPSEKPTSSKRKKEAAAPAELKVEEAESESAPAVPVVNGDAGSSVAASGTAMDDHPADHAASPSEVTTAPEEVKEAERPVEPVPEPVPEPAAPPPKRRKLDLKRFAQAAKPVEATPSSEMAPPMVDTPFSFEPPGSAIAPSEPADTVKTDVSATTVPAASGGSTGNWWDTPSTNTTKTVNGIAHADAETTSYFPPFQAPQPRVDSFAPGPALTKGLELSRLEEDVKPSFLGDRRFSMSMSDRGAEDGSTPAAEDRSSLALNGNMNAAGHESEDDQGPSDSAMDDPWSRMPAALSQRDIPPHVGAGHSRSTEDAYGGDNSLSPPFKTQSFSAANSASSSPLNRPIPAGPRSFFNGSGRERERDWEGGDRDYRETTLERDGRDGLGQGRDLPRGPRADRGRGGGGTTPASPASRGSGAPRGSFQQRGGWFSGANGRGGRGGGESFRGRGSGFMGGRGRASAPFYGGRGRGS